MNNLLFPLTSRGPPASAAASKGARPRGTGSCISVSDSLSLSLFIGSQNQVINAIYLASVWFDFVLPHGAWCSPEQLWCRPPEEEARLWLEFLNLVIDMMMNKILCVSSIDIEDICEGCRPADFSIFSFSAWAIMRFLSLIFSSFSWVSDFGSPAAFSWE